MQGSDSGKGLWRDGEGRWGDGEGRWGTRRGSDQGQGFWQGRREGAQTRGRGAGGEGEGRGSDSGRGRWQAGGLSLALPPGGHRAALLHTLYFAVDRGDRQEHLQAGDQEGPSVPRGRPAAVPQAAPAQVPSASDPQPWASWGFSASWPWGSLGPGMIEGPGGQGWGAGAGRGWDRVDAQVWGSCPLVPLSQCGEAPGARRGWAGMDMALCWARVLVSALVYSRVSVSREGT